MGRGNRLEKREESRRESRREGPIHAISRGKRQTSHGRQGVALPSEDAHDAGHIAKISTSSPRHLSAAQSNGSMS